MANLPAIEAVRGDLTKMGPEFKKVLPPNVTVERFTRVAMTAVQREPKLMHCNPGSLYRELLQCAKDGLIPDGVEAAITPFGKKGDAQYMPMIRGIYKKIRNSGEVSMLTSHVVYENDQFEFGSDSTVGDYVRFKPNLMGDRGEMIGAYAMALTKDDSCPYIEFMSAEQIEAVRKSSKAGDGPWNGPFRDEMVRKTVVRRLSKRLPMDTDAHDVLERNDEKVVGDESQAPPAAKKVTSIADMIEVEPVEVQEVKEVPAKPAKAASKPENAAGKPKGPVWDPNTSKTVEETSEPIGTDDFDSPPSKPTEKPFTRPAQAKGPKAPDHILPRAETIKLMEIAFGALSMGKAQASKWLDNIAEGTPVPQLTDVQLQVIYFDHLVPFALERGVTL